MFGKNPLRKQVRDNAEFDGRYWIQDVFTTIQGEGPLTGVPAVFIRLAGCNLRCHFCDTDFESSDKHMTPAELAARVADFTLGTHVKLAVITGGEPLRQPLGPLLKHLFAAGIDVQIETAGTLWDNSLWEFIETRGYDLYTRFTVVCSPKTQAINSTIRATCWHYKYIVNDKPGNASPHDGLPMLSTQVEGKISPVWRPANMRDPETTIWVQPETAYVPQASLNDISAIVDTVQTKRNTDHAVMLCMRYGYRLSLQTHRVLGLP